MFLSFMCLANYSFSDFYSEGFHSFTSLLLPLVFVKLHLEIIHRLEAAQF